MAGPFSEWMWLLDSVQSDRIDWLNADLCKDHAKRLIDTVCLNGQTANSWAIAPLKGGGCAQPRAAKTQ
ncbi:hypothetical protein AA23498_3373 [Acetobacter nitrogenifigens DSM 23921 = NBRC 105050]|uniref:Uncharacterized protein n=1 Tax=Acetobacter nitrogenifigens DSM 23921 = NBRC 105050 TaxID=1120919 RepID=A0A511X6N6_9PROT|nr:hypothetical protein [Acetobacter nitrogenifigens]GBQ98963.1 hypothetical protein AA23498_3373 [Acetobacter nitrogenifigens DSM 23921 = NBRC 105050]GEN58591.1 hypothetical protein ANI02nite_04750 [Acetobacter nitrogenifigens DSM 23921 = NBRC 105050]